MKELSTEVWARLKEPPDVEPPRRKQQQEADIMTLNLKEKEVKMKSSSLAENCSHEIKAIF